MGFSGRPGPEGRISNGAARPVALREMLGGDFCRFPCADSFETPSCDLRRRPGPGIGSATPVTGSAVQVTAVLLSANG